MARYGDSQGGLPALFIAAAVAAVALSPAGVASAAAEEAAVASRELATEVTELGPDLACSACAHATHSLRLLLGSKVKKSMKRKAKRTAAKKVLDEACKASRFPSQLAVHGEQGERQYKDFQELMKKGGTISNLNMSPENNEKVTRLCQSIMDKVGDDIIEKAATHKERLGGLNWERWVCVKILRVCEKPLMHLSEEEEEEEEPSEEEEEEL